MRRLCTGLGEVEDGTFKETCRELMAGKDEVLRTA